MMDEVHKNLEKQFRKLLPPDAAPEELKKVIFKTLETIDLIGDIADLFTVKFTSAEADFLDLIVDDQERHPQVSRQSGKDNQIED